MILAGKYSIREFKISDVNQKYLDWFKDSIVRSFISFKCKNLEELKNDVSLRLKEKNSLFLGIFSKQKKHIGNIFINKIDKKNKNAQLGILIGDKNYRSKGVGYISIISVISWLNKKYGINKIYLGLSKKNIHALKLYEKIGFKRIKEKKKLPFIKMQYNYVSNKYILGTAQFNSDYGITNNKKLSNEYSKKILKYAKKQEINHFDLAENYNFKWQNINFKNCVLDTKISISNSILNIKKIKKKFKEIKKLNKIPLDTVYVHNPEKIFSKNGQKVYEILSTLKKNNLIKKIGVSVYSPSQLIKILKEYRIDVVQIPFSIIDQRFLRYFDYIKEKKILIYVRSIFLQGVLLSNRKIFSKNKEIIKFINFAKKIKKNKLDLCLDFVKINSLIDKIIFGVTNEKQLVSVVKSNIKNSINYSSSLSSNDLRLVDPRNWNKSISYFK